MVAGHYSDGCAKFYDNPSVQSSLGSISPQTKIVSFSKRHMITKIALIHLLGILNVFTKWLIHGDTFCAHLHHDYARADQTSEAIFMSWKARESFFLHVKRMKEKIYQQSWDRHLIIFHVPQGEKTKNFRQKNTWQLLSIDSFSSLHALTPLALSLSGLGSTWIQSSANCSGMAACV